MFRTSATLVLATAVLVLTSGCQTHPAANRVEPEVQTEGQEENDPPRHVSLRKRNLSRLANPKPKNP